MAERIAYADALLTVLKRSGFVVSNVDPDVVSISRSSTLVQAALSGNVNLLTGVAEGSVTELIREIGVELNDVLRNGHKHTFRWNSGEPRCYELLANGEHCLAFQRECRPPPGTPKPR